MEANLIKAHRKHPKLKSSELIEAIDLFLLKIETYFKSELRYDFSDQLKKGNQIFLKALQKSFSLFNDKLNKILDGNYTTNNKRELQKIFSKPVKCVLRIRKKAVNGYFDFKEDSDPRKNIKNKRNYFIKIPFGIE